ncbi:MAG: Glu-tRNA(Gln) amidotransferase subunit GatE [Candidatus Bathyarchaeota archaeon]|nr:Glu-tRNA(Gln) amidotransferase subunit GatE [Candidatus Bathyarchaeota archaeon]
MSINYGELGLKVGLECHQQLATREKLFCKCKPQLFKGEPKVLFMRRLRPTQSELGQIDPAAYFEFQKGVKILYEADSETSCLVEMDEEPPHELNREALEIALIVALMMNAKPVDEIYVMRKIVIDGSNTTGFQRTCVVALNGSIEVDGKIIPIQHISLEEDAARKMGEEGLLVRYRIDRLGIPLIEVTTGPVINTPEEAEKVALAIGRILRATRRVKRGIGTIRQDLNISIKDGALVEIKGVQDLELISKVVEYEVQRQLNLLKIRNELRRRGLKDEDLKDEFFDVTAVFKETKCRVLQRALSKGATVLAVKLPKFSGLLGFELIPGLRLGSEMSDRAKFWGRVGGILHTDEIASYGVSDEEIANLRRWTNASQEDAIVLVADKVENAVDALKAVVERACEALKGVPEETRAANPDGTTRYMRPRPGAARMYPETDVPPVKIARDYLERLRRALPEPPEETVRRLMNNYGINEKLARQLSESEYTDLFETIVKETGVSPTFVAATLTETFKALRRENVNLDIISDEQIIEIFRLVGLEKTSKESIPEIVKWLASHEGATPSDAIKELGLIMISEDTLKRLIDECLERNRKIVAEKGMGAFGVLMGILMRDLRGRVKPETVNKMLKERMLEEIKRFERR